MTRTSAFAKTHAGGSGAMPPVAVAGSPDQISAEALDGFILRREPEFEDRGHHFENRDHH